MSDPHPDPPADGVFVQFLDKAVGRALQFGEAAPFLEWFEQEFPAYSSEWMPQAAPEGVRAAARMLGRSVWNQVPLPRNRFRPDPLPRPERNDPCPCGSGSKFKRCCAHIPLPAFEPEMVWSMAVGHLSPVQMREAIEHGQIPVMTLGQLADEALQRGDPQRAIAVLDPLFAGEPATFDHRHATVLNLLCNAYDEHYARPTKKTRLLERLTAAQDKAVRANAWQRLASFRMDQGDDDEAWRCFQEAQRADPGDPDLAPLELLLLLARGEQARASERARFWLQRYRSLGIDDPERLKLLTDAVGDPAGAFANLSRDRRDPQLLRLEELLMASAMLEAPQYETDSRSATDSNERSLVPPAAIAELEQRWHDCYPVGKPFSTQPEPMGAEDPWQGPGVERWLQFLHSHPRAFDSLDILDDLLIAIDLHREVDLPGIHAKLAAPIVERAAKILERAVAGRPLTLPWGCIENRPGLRLLSRRINWLLDQHRDDEAAALMQRLLALNPNDNHGYRFLLMNRLLRQNDNQAALLLWDRYPDDWHSPEMSFGRALAQFRLGQTDAAGTTLCKAHKELPEVRRALTAARFKTPRPNELGGYVVGGPDQAGIYRLDMLDVWQATPGALDWLRRTSKAGN